MFYLNLLRLLINFSNPLKKFTFAFGFSIKFDNRKAAKQPAAVAKSKGKMINCQLCVPAHDITNSACAAAAGGSTSIASSQKQLTMQHVL